MNNILTIDKKQNRLWNWICYHFYYRWKYRCGKFEKFIFPVIKNMDTSMSVKDFMLVQPMNYPPGQVFYMDFKHVMPLPWYKRWMWWKK